ncbi:MAG: hypothetical protein LBT86_02940 [Deltaproteobacteria bacterium]|nr:hypothetical protein [Deltaproteobacteria bacterium]
MELSWGHRSVKGCSLEMVPKHWGLWGKTGSLTLSWAAANLPGGFSSMLAIGDGLLVNWRI